MADIEPDYENIEKYFPFPSMRDGQLEVIQLVQKYLLDPDIKFILVEAGTGFGKSALALTAAGASQSAYVATANKFLQDQYVRDFSDIMVDLKGRSNYQCDCYTVPDALKPTIGEYYNCANSPCRTSKDGRSKCARDGGCEYHRQLFAAAKANITCFNFASALAFLNYLSNIFKNRNLIICDECHNIPNWITNFVGIEISLRTLKDFGFKQKIPDYDSVDDYASFITSIQKKITELLEDEDGLDHKLIHKLENFQSRLKVFDAVTNNKQDMENFVLEKIYDGEVKFNINKIVFKPVVVSKIAHQYLLKHAKKVLLLSATILDFKTYVDMMGIDPKQTAIIKVPSTFPVENRPIFTHMSVGYINKNNLDYVLPDMVKVIRAIIDYYPNVKGIIHGVTYKICDYIYDNLDSNRILYPRKADQQKNYFVEHMETERPTILLSPSMTEGVDLKYDASRVQIMVKVPYAYLGDPVLKARIKIYQNYYNMLTALNLTQAYGRSVRSDDDKCFTFMLDRCLLSFIYANSDILQSTFIQAVDVNSGILQSTYTQAVKRG